MGLATAAHHIQLWGPMGYGNDLLDNEKGLGVYNQMIALSRCTCEHWDEITHTHRRLQARELL